MCHIVDKDPDGKILVIVSPLTRTIFATCMLFHRLALWRDVCVVVDPAAMEVVNEPHDLVENLGRPMEDVFEELTEVLQARNAPVGAFMLLEKLRGAASHLDADWWFHPTTPTALPMRVYEGGMDARAQRLRKSVQEHVSRTGDVVRVFVVTHEGVTCALNDGVMPESSMFVVSNFFE